MSSRLRQTLFLLFACAACAELELPPGYLTDPSVDHQQLAIRLDAAGRLVESHECFLASARFTEAVDSYDNLGVSHMRRGEHVLAAQSFRHAFDKAAQPSRNLLSNIQTLKGMLGNVKEPDRSQALALLDGSSSSQPPAAPPREPPRRAALSVPTATEIYAGERLAPDAKIPLRRSFANRTAFWRFLASDRFVCRYAEKRPLLMRVGEEGGGADSFVPRLPSLEAVLSATYTYGMASSEPGHANANFVAGSFLTMNTLGYAFPQRVSRRELEHAMGADHTVILHAHQLWAPSVATFQRRAARVFKRHANTNTCARARHRPTRARLAALCDAARATLSAHAADSSLASADLTGPAVEAAMAPHNDIQDTLVVQVHGAKRWKLWVVPRAMLPLTDDLIFGKHREKVLDAEAMGPPYADVVLRRGEVLYVPRGCIHGTSTRGVGAAGKEGGTASASAPMQQQQQQQQQVSLHYTVGLAMDGDVKAGPIGLAHVHALGVALDGPVGERVRRALLDRLREAAYSLSLRDAELRRTADVEMLLAGLNHTRRGEQLRAGGAAGEAAGGAAAKEQSGGEWKAGLRQMMHRVVDELFDQPAGYAEEYAAAMYTELSAHFAQPGAERHERL
jgi:hypothetical protein